MDDSTQVISERDPIPENFDTLAEAAEFWDTHSAADYWDLMEEVDVEFKLKGRVFLVEIQEAIYERASRLAKLQEQSVEEVVNRMLARELEKLPAL